MPKKQAPKASKTQAPQSPQWDVQQVNGLIDLKVSLQRLEDLGATVVAVIREPQEAPIFVILSKGK